MQITTGSAKETRELGKKIARHLRGGEVLGLFGQLGSGKTTFVKGLAQGLGVKKNAVSSPSFVLMREYKGKIPLYHFDLYRIKKPAELCDIGYEEFVFGKAVTAIEWAQKMQGLLPKDYLRIEFSFLKPKKRSIKFSVRGKGPRKLLSRL